MENNKTQPSVGFQFGTFMRTFRKLIVKRFSETDAGLTLEQFGVLFKINEENEPTQTEVANSLGMDKSAVMRIIDVLESKRLVARLGDDDDRRRKILLLTKQGAERVKETELFFDSIIEEISDGVKENEMKHFIKVLEQLQHNAEQKASN